MAKKKTKFLTRDQILNAKDREPVEIATPKWGGSVFMRPPSAAEMPAPGHEGRPRRWPIFLAFLRIGFLRMPAYRVRYVVGISNYLIYVAVAHSVGPVTRCPLGDVHGFQGVFLGVPVDFPVIQGDTRCGFQFLGHRDGYRSVIRGFSRSYDLMAYFKHSFSSQ